MLMVNHLIGFGAGASAQRLPTIAYQTTVLGTSNASSYTFTSTAFGTVSATRQILVGVVASHLTANLSEVSSCTIGGVSATRVYTDGTGFTQSHQFWIAAVPTGTTGTIDIARAANMGFAIVRVWAVYDLISASPVGTLASSSANPSTGSLTVTADGVSALMASVSGGTFTAVSGMTLDAQGTGTGTASPTQWLAASLTTTPGGSLALSTTHSASAHSFRAIAFR